MRTSNQKSSPGTEEKKETSNLEEVVSFFKTIAIFIALAIFLRGSVVEAFKIPSGSMKPTLKIGDHIIVTKFNYGFRLPFIVDSLANFRMPARGDIVVFTRFDDPSTFENEADKNYIKRVIGLPGETIEVRNRMVYVNNEAYPEEYARWGEGGILAGNFGPEVVPEGHIILLGDNRDHSLDSRFWPSPFLPIERVKGKALVVYWSWDSLSRIGTLIR